MPLPLFERPNDPTFVCEDCPTETRVKGLPLGWLQHGRSKRPGREKQLAAYCPVCAQKRWPVPGSSAPAF
jgi:hypothetical protein